MRQCRQISRRPTSKEGCRADGVTEKVRGRLEKWSCDVINTARTREVIKADSKCVETFYGLASPMSGWAGGNRRPGASAPGNQEQGAGPTGFTLDEDRCRPVPGLRPKPRRAQLHRDFHCAPRWQSFPRARGLNESPEAFLCLSASEADNSARLTRLR